MVEGRVQQTQLCGARAVARHHFGSAVAKLAISGDGTQAVVTSIYGDGDDSGEGQVTFDAGNINVFGVTLPDDPDDDDDLY